jgi:fluoroacetyl-CoA thioesterase
VLERNDNGRPAPGQEVSHEVVVTDEMLAILFDRVVHRVYGTAWMVRHMEEAGRLLVEPHLGADEDATGYRIEVTHQRPARPGERLRVTARCTFADEDQCVAEVEVRGPQGVVGRGTFVQRYVRKGAL